MGGVGGLSWGLRDIERACGVAGGRLTLQEVREIDRTAFFFDFGEALMYKDGKLFDIRSWGAEVPTGAPLTPLPDAVLENGVGIEYGWQHLKDCDCHLCELPAWQKTASTDARQAA